MGRQGNIYFIQQKSVDGYIKIGFSAKVASRRNDLQVASAYKLEILAILEESQTMEGIIHTILKDSWVSGEWFKPTAEVLKCIDYVNDNNFGLFIQEAVHSKKI